MDASTARTRNIRALVAQHGGPSKFAMQIGRDQVQVSQWISKTKPKLLGSRLSRYIESAAGKPHGWLDTVHTKTAASIDHADTRTKVETYVRFALLEGFTSQRPDQPEAVPFVEVSKAWARDKLSGVPVESIRVISSHGDSMRGLYEDGDIIFVDIRDPQFGADSAYVFRHGGRVQIKRLQWIGKDTVRILSENSKYPPVETLLSELEIAGRALAVWTLKAF